MDIQPQTSEPIPGRCHCDDSLDLREDARGDPVIWCLDCNVQADDSCGPVT